MLRTHAFFLWGLLSLFSFSAGCQPALPPADSKNSESTAKPANVLSPETSEASDPLTPSDNASLPSGQTVASDQTVAAGQTAAADQAVAPSLSSPQRESDRRGFSLAELDEQGAILNRTDQGQIKSIDVSDLDHFDAFLPEEENDWKSLRVLRGRGVLSERLAQNLVKMPQLTELLWTQTQLDSAALAFLGNLKGQKSVKKIRLAGLQSDKKQAVFLWVASFPSLTELDLSGSCVTDQDLQSLDWSQSFPKLERLNFYDTALTDQGVEALLPLKNQLTWLNLDKTSISNDAVALLPQFSQLTFLHLGRTAITDDAFDSLAQMSSLKTLHITRTQISPVTAEKLRNALKTTQLIDKVEE